MSDWKNVQYKDGKMRTSEGGGGGGSSTFAGLDDVSFNNIQNGQVPKYNSTTNKWENANESGGEIVKDVEVNGTSVVNAQNVAEIKSYKEVTQAEYNALPASKTSDGILYCIKDSAGADGFPPLIYSDEERVVGVWRDGKPLYQKTINVDFVNGRRDYQHGIQNVDMIFFDDSATFIYAKDKSEFNHFYNAGYNDSAQFVEGYGRFIQNVSRTTIILKANPNIGNTLSAIITLRYTKTTDTAGSGTWTTQGGYAHHYSTNEKVIGTWIDGKPIYEKVIPVTTTAQSYRLDVSALNIDYVVFIKIRIKNANNLSHSYCDSAYWFSNTDWFRYYFPENNSIIIFESGSAFSYGSGYVILQYTKTTD